MLFLNGKLNEIPLSILWQNESHSGWQFSFAGLQGLEPPILLFFGRERTNSAVAISLWILRITYGRYDIVNTSIRILQNVKKTLNWYIKERTALWEMCERKVSGIYNFRARWGWVRMSNWLPNYFQSFSLLGACVTLRIL